MLYYNVFSLILLVSCTPPQINGQKSKLCGNDKCNEPLFTSSFSRTYDPPDERFLKAVEKTVVKVYAIKFSDRTDIMEGEDDQGNRGLFFSGHIDLVPYVFYLESALKQNNQMFVIGQEFGPGRILKLLGEKPANPELFRDYLVNAQNFGIDPDPNILEIQKESKNQGHGHSHGGHGHSHSHSHEHHGHSHEHDGHSHEHENLNKIEVEKKVEEPKIIEEVKKEKPNVENLQNVVNTEKLVQEPIATSTETNSQETVLQQEAQQNAQNQAQASPVNTPQEKIEKQESIENEKNTEEKTIDPPPPTPSTLDPIVTAHAHGHPRVVDTYVQPKIVDIEQVGQKQENGQRVEETHKETGENSTESPNRVKRDETQSVTQNEIQAENSTLETVSEAQKKIDEIPKNEPKIGINIDTIDQILKEAMHTSTTPAPEVQNLPKKEEILTTTTLPPVVETPTTPAPKIEETPTTQAPEPQKIETTTQKIVETTPTPKSEEISTPKVEVTTPAPKIEDIPTTTQAPKVVDIHFEPKIEKLTTPAPKIEEITTTTTQTPKVEKIPDDPVIHENKNLHTEHDHGENKYGKEEKKEMYCYKENCDELNDPSNSNESFTHPTNAPAWLLSIRSILKPAVNQLRGILPPPMANFDDTGILILIFLVIAIISKLISLVLADKKHQDVVDRRILHDSITRIKEQDVMIAQLKEQASKPRESPELAASVQEIGNLRTEIQKIYNEKENLKSIVANLESERDRLKSSVDHLSKEKDIIEKKNAQFKNDLTEKRQEVDTLAKESQGFKDHNSKLLYMVQERDKKLENLEEERERLHEKVDELEGVVRKMEKEKRELVLEAERATELGFMVSDLKKKLVEAETQAQTQQPRKTSPVEKDEENGESGTSAGWSDVGELDVGDETEQPKKAKSIEKEQKENTTKEKSPIRVSPERKISTQVDDDFSSVMEVASLRTDIRKLESERDKYKFSLETIQKEKEALEQRCEQVKSDLSEKRREMDELKIECQGFKDHNNKLFSMVQDRDKKLEHLEEERERLRDKISDVEQEMRKLENEKRDTQGKIKDLEQLVKKTEEQNLKLENKLYHEERRLGTKVRSLEEQLLKNTATLSSNNSGGGEPLSMSGGSSDREIHGGLLEMRSLWSDVEGPEMEFSPQPTNEFRRDHRRSARDPRSTSPTQESLGPRSARQSFRGDDRDPLPNPIPSTDKERRHRVRSRSHGRQPAAPRLPALGLGTISSGLGAYPPPIGGGNRASPARYHEERYFDRPLRHTKSGNLYYSSDGSNGARSPPPEMPLVSGVPPLGMIKRPATVTPKLGVQIHKPMPPK